jgi:hypothetical protein
MSHFQTLMLSLVLLAPMSMAQSRYANDVLALNPLGYWRLNGDATDATANGNGGALINGVTFTSPGGGAPIGDPNNQAALFTSARDQYVNIPSAASSPLFALDWNHPLTMMIWVKTTDTTGSIILAKEENSGKYRGPYLFVDGGPGGIAPPGAGRFGLIIQATVTTGPGVTGGNFLALEALNSINDGNWHFLVGTYDGSGQANGIKLYVDGEAAPTVVVGNGNSLNGLTTLNNVPVTIGSRDTGGVPYGGLLDEAAIFGTALTPQQVQQLENDTFTSSKILSQFAFGGGWYSALYFTNTGTSAVSFPVSFTADNGAPLTVPSLGGSSTTVSLAPRGTAIIEALNSGALSQGYVAVTLPGGVTGYGVFRQSVPGIPDQEAVVPLAGASTTTSTLIWDDTNFTTAVAIVNLSSVANTVSIVVRDSTGATIGTSSVSLAAKSKSAVALRDLPGLAGIAGHRGSADFSVGLGNLAVLGLRFGGAAFTSIPTTDR